MLKYFFGGFLFVCCVVRKFMKVICLLWSLRIWLLFFGLNEIIVSNVVEFFLDGWLLIFKDMKEFNGKVMIVILYSVIDLKGYELVVKKLINDENKDWEDLEIRSIWRELSRNIVEYCSRYCLCYKLIVICLVVGELVLLIKVG